MIIVAACLPSREAGGPLGRTPWSGAEALAATMPDGWSRLIVPGAFMAVS